MRIKKLLRWTMIGMLSIVAAVVLIVAFLNWRAARQVNARLAPLREAGKPLSIQDLQPPPVPDDQNAAKAIEQWKDAFGQFNQQLAEATVATQTQEQEEAGSITVARSIASEFPDLTKNLREASRLPEYQPDHDYSLAPTAFMEGVLKHQGPPRTGARILYGHGLMSIADGKTDEAMRDAIAILAWSKHIAEQPLLIHYLISSALFEQALDLASRSLYVGDASPEVLAEFLVLLDDDTSLVTEFSKTMDTERAFGISSFDSFPLARFQFMLGQLAAYLDTVGEIKALIEQPTGIAPPNPTTSSGFAALAWPAVGSALAVMRRNQAKSRAVRVLAAWQADGRNTNAALEDLGLPESVIVDPFDGSKMKWQVIGDTIAVYSVGVDLVDDGGSIEDARDIGVHPR